MSGLIDRREFLASSAAAATVASQLGGCRPEAAKPPVSARPVFELDEITIAQLQDGVASGRFTSTAVTQQYLDRIAALDHSGPSVNSVIELNPEALVDAGRRDAERTAGKSRGPLHGVPVLLKDNIDTGDRMRTSAGSWALADIPAPHDAFVVERLRAAGAVILGKTNPSEWANFRSSHSTSGWSGGAGRHATRTHSTAIRAARVLVLGPPSAPISPRQGSARKRTARWSAPARPTGSSGSSPPSAS